MPRILAISDLHVDYSENMRHMLSLSNQDYTEDILLVAGDVSDHMDQLEQLLESMRRKFKQVAYVPGNHELWLRKGDATDSLEKFTDILALCRQLGVLTEAFKVGQDNIAVWVVPLYSWYRTADTDEHSLLITKEGEDWAQGLWMDEYYCNWPERFIPDDGGIADYFLTLNLDHIQRQYDAPVISFSHFLPRKELIFNRLEHVERFCQKNAVIPIFPQDPAPMFNFSRVAGCAKLDNQIRQLGANLHVYGHQHLHRNRRIGNITYVSNCLGYARERHHLGENLLPKLLWSNGIFLEADDFMQ